MWRVSGRVDIGLVVCSLPSCSWRYNRGVVAFSILLLIRNNPLPVFSKSSRRLLWVLLVLLLHPLKVIGRCHYMCGSDCVCRQSMAERKRKRKVTIRTGRNFRLASGMMMMITTLCRRRPLRIFQTEFNRYHWDCIVCDTLLSSH